MEKERIEIKSNCYYYSWGGDFDKKFPVYPREYGARCQFFDKFFGSKGFGCKGCKEFPRGTKMEELRKLSNEALVKKIIVNSVKASRLGMVTIQSNDTLVFDHHHPSIEIAKELNEAKDELLRRLKKK